MIKEELEYSISQAIMTLNNPSATKLIMKGVEQYANQKAIEIAGEAWDECIKTGMLPLRNYDRQQYLSNLKKKLDDKAQ